MKIVKTPFRTEIELGPTELRDLFESNLQLGEVGMGHYVGILNWLKNNFGLDLFPVTERYERRKNSKT